MVNISKGVCVMQSQRGERKPRSPQSGRQFVKCVVPGFFILVFIIDVSNKREREGSDQ